MLERIIIAIILALLEWLEKRYAKSATAVDADRRPDALARIGERVREWEDRARAGRQPDPGGTGN